MGKFVDGVVWFNVEMCSFYEFWQFWCNMMDVDVGWFLKFYIELLVDECDCLGFLVGFEINEVKVILVNEVMIFCYGVDVVVVVEVIVCEVFEKGGVGVDFLMFLLFLEDIGDGIFVVQLIVKFGFVKFGKEVKCLIVENGVKLDDQLLIEMGCVFIVVDLGFLIKLSVGKKCYVLVQLI